MKKLVISSLFFFFASMVLWSCKDSLIENYSRYTDDDYSTLSEHLRLPEQGHDYLLEFPPYLAAAGGFNSFVNLEDNDKITLGRVLFYDTNLSMDRSVSCASCHEQSKGFSDDVSLSRGANGLEGSRNSIALGSVFSFAAYYGQISTPSRIPFLWDNSATSPQAQITKAFEADNEMGIAHEDILARVQEQPYYDILFKYAYPNETITTERVIDALAAFVNSIGSFNSKFDQSFTNYVNDTGTSFLTDLPDNFSGFTAVENHGMQLYETNCGSCHGTLLNAPTSRSGNNGLDIVSADLGIGAITGNASDNGTFKVPTLRNITLTAPYMHDGRFASLDEVLEHYSNGIQNHPNLSSSLKEGSSPKQMNFSQTEKDALIAFLNTLTDNELLTDDKYSNPFE